MDNINFLTIKIRREYYEKRVRSFKQMVLVLWLICLVIFIYYNYLCNKSKETIENKTLIQDNSLSDKAYVLPRRNSTQKTLSTFISSLDKKFTIRKLNISDKKMELEILMPARDEYKNITKFIESDGRYRISFLSPLFEYKDGYKFNLTIEVK